MARNVICPQCNCSFDATRHMKNRVAGLSSLVAVSKSHPRSLVEGMKDTKCPCCGHEFAVDDYRFLGVLGPLGVSLVFLSISVLMLVLALKQGWLEWLISP